MMNEIETRIIKLADLISINTKEKSKELAELKGYATGLNMIFSDLDEITQELSPITATGYAFGLFCDMFGIDFSLADNEKRELIKTGFEMTGTDYTDGEFEQKIAEAHLTAVLSAGNLTLAAAAEHTAQDYKLLAKILENYAVPNLYITFNGDGMTFEKWEQLDFMFNEFDRLKFTFAMLDTMRTEEL